MKKRFLALTLTLVMAISLAACGGSNSSDSSSAASSEPAVAAAEDTAGESAVSESSEAAEEAEDTSEEVGQAKSDVLPAPTKKDGPLHLAFVPVAMNPYQQQVFDGINEEIDRYGGEEFATCDFLAPSNEETMASEQVEILEQLLLDDDLDALFFSTHNDEQFIPYLKQFCEKGVPVFLFVMPSQDATNEYYCSMVSYEFEGAGAMCAQYIADYFDGKECNLLLIEGMEGSHNTARVGGFMSVIDQYDNINVVVDQCGNWTREGGQSVTENALESNPEINAVWGPYDEMLLGSVVALKEKNRLDDVLVVGYDLEEAARDSILEGEMDASLLTNPKGMGVKLVDCAISYCLEGVATERFEPVETIMYDSSNIAEATDELFGYVPQEKSKEVNR